MPKIPTFPRILDDELRLSVSDLKKMGFLAPGSFRSGRINWGLPERTEVSFRITVDLAAAGPYVEFDYTYFGRPMRYRVCLVNVPSNLGRGRVWYFLCHRTRKRCRVLYAIDGYFLHRDAYPGAVYDCQTWSKSSRGWAALAKLAFDKPPTRKYYKGKKTRRYKRWLAKSERREATATDCGLIEPGFVGGSRRLRSQK